MSAAWTCWNLSSYRWLIYRETDLKIHFRVLHASFVDLLSCSYHFWTEQRKRKKEISVTHNKKKIYITSPLNTSMVLPLTLAPTDNSKCSHEVDSKWEEEKRCQPIKSTWWRTVMIRKELEEMGVTWHKAQAKAQDRLGWGGWVREWVSECFATFEKLWSPSLCSQNLQLLSLAIANIP